TGACRCRCAEERPSSETLGFAWSAAAFSAADLEEPVRILVLNEYYPPDTSATAKCAAVVVEALAQRHEVTVLAGRPSYDPTERHPPYLLRREVRGNVTIERVGSTAFPRFNMKGRLANYFSYLALAIPRALMVRADVVIAMTDPPFEGLAGALVCKLTGRSFI